MYRLAVMAGEWDVSVIENGLTAKKFLGWAAYAQLEPFDEMRADYRSAQVAATVFNMAVAVKDRKPIGHFLLPWDVEETEQKKQPTKEQIAQKQWELLNIYARAHAGLTPSVEDTRSDLVGQKKLRDQVAQAHAAMKET